jgi:hypothetical protein
MKKTLAASLLIIALLLSTLLCSCGKTESEVPETRVIKQWNDVWNGKTVETEIFDYFELFPDDDGHVLKVKGDGYRLVLRDPETGSTECVCRDPLCLHSTMAECPAVSANPIIKFAVIGDTLYYYTTGGHYAGSGPGKGDIHSLNYIDLTGAESGTVFSWEGYEQNSYYLGYECVFFIVPDIVEDKTVFLLKRYDYSKRTEKTLTSFDSQRMIRLLTDTRVYVGKIGYSVSDPADIDMYSYDYDGGNPREEPGLLAFVQLGRENLLYCNETVSVPTRANLMNTTKILCYDIRTREYTEFVGGENVVSLGFCEKDGRIYYITSAKADKWLCNNVYTRSAELGITVEQFMENSEERKKLSAEISDAMYNDTFYLKSCNPDGSDLRTCFAFEPGTAFMSSGGNTVYGSFPTTCNVSRDGEWYHVTEIRQGTRREARINLETGANEYAEA